MATRLLDFPSLVLWRGRELECGKGGRKGESCGYSASKLLVEMLAPIISLSTAAWMLNLMPNRLDSPPIYRIASGMMN
ncbi:hypothetical protein CRG98_011701 [Punica granatum]|uniref:Uncharacterized protein n=1 Tax=Punica granatum TaxID=22663 RepID=A0A2I0KHV9_PUNGR|nr:hypothetical protein CRG98_011701 [Punica granatum]